MLYDTTEYPISRLRERTLTLCDNHTEARLQRINVIKHSVRVYTRPVVVHSETQARIFQLSLHVVYIDQWMFDAMSESFVRT
jgi:hypothetical protein